VEIAAITPFEGMDIRTLIENQAHRRGDHAFLVWEPFEGAVITGTVHLIAS
jgi:carnitine-CoA ligase